METIVYYDGKNLENKINDLKSKLEFASDEEKAFLEKDIKNYEYGLKGEKKILYELKNSHIPMYILHDLKIEYKDYKAQIDYIVITKKLCYIFECKNYYGNILIDEDDDFYRVVGKDIFSIYNPITQLNRHLDIIKEFIYDKNGFIGRILTNYAFNNYYRGCVIIANENAQIKFKNKNSKIKNKVIRLDKIVDYIKKEERNSKNYSDSEKEIKDFADKILSLNVDKEINDRFNETDYEINKDLYNLDEILRNKLKKYRFNKAKSLKYKPYFIFTDKTLDDLVKKKPSTIEELKKISGISTIKISRYGKEILRVINN